MRNLGNSVNRYASKLLFCLFDLFHYYFSICTFIRVARVPLCFLYNCHIKYFYCSCTQLYMYINNYFYYKLITQLYGDSSLVYGLVLMYNTSETITAMNDVRVDNTPYEIITIFYKCIVIISYFIGYCFIIYNSDAMILLTLPVLPIGK